MFRDSSQDFFSAVTLLRSKINSEHGSSTELGFDFGKARVAPMNALTRTKLDLQAAFLSVRLKDDIQEALTPKIEEFHMERLYYGTPTVKFARKATGFCSKLYCGSFDAYNCRRVVSC